MNPKFLSLDAEQVAELKTLHSDARFKLYCKVLDKLITMHTENLLTISEDFDLHRGQALGIRKARRLIDDLIDQENTKANVRDTKPAEQRREANRRNATFGSSWQRLWSRARP